jgi:hypothetical protein
MDGAPTWITPPSGSILPSAATPSAAVSAPAYAGNARAIIVVAAARARRSVLQEPDAGAAPRSVETMNPPPIKTSGAGPVLQRLSSVLVAGIDDPVE